MYCFSIQLHQSHQAILSTEGIHRKRLAKRNRHALYPPCELMLRKLGAILQLRTALFNRLIYGQLLEAVLWAPNGRVTVR